MIDFSVGGFGNAIIWVAAGVAGATLAQPIANQLEAAIRGGA